MTNNYTTECLWEALSPPNYDPAGHRPWRWQDRVRDLGEDEATARGRAIHADSPVIMGLRKMIKDRGVLLD